MATRAHLIDLLLLRGEVLGRIADYEHAAELAVELVHDAPDDARAWLARARTRATFHRFAEALADLETAGQNSLDRAMMDAERVPILQAVGCYWHALVLCEDAAKRRPGFTTLGALAVLQAEHGEVAAAELLFADARRCYQDVSPFPIASLDYRRGLMWLGQGDLPAARTWFCAAQRRCRPTPRRWATSPRSTQPWGLPRPPSAGYAPWRPPATTRTTRPASPASCAPRATTGKPANGTTSRQRATPNWSCATRRPSPTTRPTSGPAQQGLPPASRKPADASIKARKGPKGARAMLAARLNVKTLTLSMDDVPIPDPGPGQVRVKVRAAGVCLSDVHLIDGSVRPLHLMQQEVTLGHEIAGTIDALGPGVTGYPVGQRVALQAGEERGGVLYARGGDYDGGWAEYTLATATTLVPIPANLPFEQAAIIPDAVSTSWAAITATAQVRAGRGRRRVGRGRPRRPRGHAAALGRGRPGHRRRPAARRPGPGAGLRRGCRLRLRRRRSWPPRSATRPTVGAWRRRSTSPGSQPCKNRPSAAWARPGGWCSSGSPASR